MGPLEKALFEAINSGNVAGVVNAINSGAEVNGRNPELFTALHVAVYLLDRDADGSKRYANIINKLLNANADPILLTDGLGFNVLQQVIYRGSRLYDDNKVRAADQYFELAEELLHRLHSHSNFNQALNNLLNPNNGKLQGVSHTLLQMAVYFGWTRMVKKLLKFGPDIQLVNGVGLTALHLATLMCVYSKNPEYISILESLLTHQAISKLQLVNQPWTGTWYAQVNAWPLTTKIQGNGDTPLHTAVKYKSIPLIQLLLKHNADISVLNAAKKTAEQIARDNNNAEIVGLFDEVKLARLSVSSPCNVHLVQSFGLCISPPVNPNISSKSNFQPVVNLPPPPPPFILDESIAEMLQPKTGELAYQLKLKAITELRQPEIEELDYQFNQDDDNSVSDSYPYPRVY